MGNWQRRSGVVEDDPPTPAPTASPTPDDTVAVPAAADGLHAEGSEGADYEELLERERRGLCKIAGGILKGSCPDPTNDVEDVVHSGVVKVCRAAKNREYENPAGMLQVAVRQEAIKHVQVGHREQAVDIERVYSGRETSDTPNLLGCKPREVIQRGSHDPTEIYLAMLYLEEMLEGSDVDLFDMYFVQGMTQEEIAERRGCATSTVNRGVAKLREVLEQVRAVTPSPES